MGREHTNLVSVWTEETHKPWCSLWRKAERNDVVTLTASVGAWEHILVKSLRRLKLRLLVERSSVHTSRVYLGWFSFSRLISEGTRSVSSLRHVRDAFGCVCMRATCTSQRECEHAQRAHTCVSMYARLVGSGSEVKRRDWVLLTRSRPSLLLSGPTSWGRKP